MQGQVVFHRQFVQLRPRLLGQSQRTRRGGGQTRPAQARPNADPAHRLATARGHCGQSAGAPAGAYQARVAGGQGQAAGVRVESKAQVAAQSLEPIASYNAQCQDTATEPATTDPVAAIEAAFLQAA